MKLLRVHGRALASIAVLLLAGISCHPREGTAVPRGVRYLGKIIEPSLRESSGVAASRRYNGVFWTHNDSQNREVLYAITRNGASLGQWRIAGVHLIDWEDITFETDTTLLIADTGDNLLCRNFVSVYRINEPDPARREGSVTIERWWQLRYPAGPRNCESIFVLGTNAFLITKRKGASAEVYRFPLSPTTNSLTLELVAELNVGSAVKGAAVSPDGKLLALVSRVGAMGYRIDGDISRAHGAAPDHLTKFGNRRIEGCTFVPDGLLTTSESRHIYLFTNEFFRSH